MGRKAGVPNKVTTDFKAAVVRLLNTSNIEKLFKDVPPERRLDILAKLAEYAFPKLGRTEVSGPGGGPVEADFSINFGPKKE